MGIASDQGDAQAQSHFGNMYLNRQGVLQDYIRAHMWLNVSGANENEDGRKGRESIKKQMTPTQIAKAQKLAAEMWEKINN